MKTLFFFVSLILISLTLISCGQEAPQVTSQPPTQVKPSQLAASPTSPQTEETVAATIPPFPTSTVIPPTSTPAPITSCEGAPAIRYKVGDMVMVSTEPPLPSRIRDAAGKSGQFLGQAEPGEFVRITGGPQCADGYTWWQVQSEQGLAGWTVEGDASGLWLTTPPAAEACKDIAPKPKLGLGQSVYVNNEPPVNSRVRLFPSREAEILGEVSPGAELKISAGPVCSDNYIWWQVQNSLGLIGWTVEGDKTSDWLVTTLPNPCVGGLPMRLAVGQQAIVAINNIVNNRLREAPGKEGKILSEMPPGTMLEVTGGPKCADNKIWWQVSINNSETGWTAEGDDKAYWLSPVKEVVGKGKLIVVYGARNPIEIVDTATITVVDSAAVEEFTNDSWKGTYIYTPWFAPVFALAPNGKSLAYVKSVIDQNGKLKYEIWVQPISLPSSDGKFRTPGKKIFSLDAKSPTEVSPIERIFWNDKSDKLYFNTIGEYFEIGASGGEPKKLDLWPQMPDPRLVSPKGNKMLRYCPDFIGITQNDDLFLCVTPADGGDYTKVAELQHTFDFQVIWLNNETFLLLHFKSDGTDFYLGNTENDKLVKFKSFINSWSSSEDNFPMKLSPDGTLVAIPNSGSYMIELHSVENLLNGIYAPVDVAKGNISAWLP